MRNMIKVEGVSKSFTLHLQQGATLSVLHELNLDVACGECVALSGPSGSGKSTLMRMIYGNYLCPTGSIHLQHQTVTVDVAHADAHQILAVRRLTLGYVSQFLRVVPRVPTLDIVAEPLIAAGADRDVAQNRARELLRRLNLPERLWALSPVTFSGGEQQRVNIARGFAYAYPILLLDEPTASLDANNRAVVLELIEEARDRGTAILGIFHDQDTRDAVCTRSFDISEFQEAA
jgi:alpha-D-ribose 1-methylphosphonate 5-triphosphate synthase subunit PhnL